MVCQRSEKGIGISNYVMREKKWQRWIPNIAFKTHIHGYN